MSGPSGSTPPLAVFLSYAREDAAVTRRMAETLRAVGVEVWFDENELRGGDAWDRAIRKQVQECALFVPVISASTQARTEGYFRLEWHLAEQRSLLMAKGRPFIVPVCIDATPEREALVPDAFMAVQWTRFVGGEAPPAFAPRIRELLRPGPFVKPLTSSAPGAVLADANGTVAPRIADYELTRRIGRGSYGDVWLARGVTGIYRAIKVVWRGRFADAAPFEREFKGLTEFAAISLGESVQLALLHVGRDDAAGFFYYVMELADDAVRGREIDPAHYVPLTLAEVHTRRGRVPAGECIGYGVELARVLGGLHRRGLVHRDIKPSNVILVGGVPKLADIGLVTTTDDASTFVGTEGFVPPEGPGSPAADVFALGKVLYELSTGLDRHLFPQLPPDARKLPDRRVLFELNEILLRACDPALANRYPDASVLLKDLLALQAGSSLRQRRIGQKMLRVGLAAAAGVALVAGGMFAWSKRPAAVPVVAAVAPAASNVAAMTDPKSIAVLPFENLSEDKDSAYFTGGLHGEILASLTRITQLRVIPRTSVERYRGTKKPLAQIATELGVAYVLEGTVQRDKDRAVFAGRLFRVAGDQLVWADRFQRALSDIFALQSELSQTIAAKLQAVITPKELAALAQPPTKSTEAYQLFLKSLDLWEKEFLNSSFLERQELLERAVKLDPDFTRAWTELAGIYTFRYFMGRDRSSGQLEKARAAMDQCLRLAPDAAGTLAVLGRYNYEIRRDYAQGLEYFRRAVQLEPNVVEHHVNIALILRRQGKWIESTAKLRHAAQIDPYDVDPMRFLAMNMGYTRRYAESAEMAQRVRVMQSAKPDDGSRAARTAFLLTGSPKETDAFLAARPEEERESKAGLARRHGWAMTKGDFAEALRIDGLLSPPETRPRDSVGYTIANALALAATGDLAGARARLGDKPTALRAQLEKNPGGGASAGEWGHLAQMAALLGHRDEVMRCAAKAEDVFPEANDALWGPPTSLKLASARAWLGDKDHAIAELKRLLRVVLDPDGNVHAIRHSAAFFPLRGDPRFEALLNDPRNNAPLF